MTITISNLHYIFIIIAYGYLDVFGVGGADITATLRYRYRVLLNPKMKRDIYANTNSFLSPTLTLTIFGIPFFVVPFVFSRNAATIFKRKFRSEDEKVLSNDGLGNKKEMSQ